MFEAKIIKDSICNGHRLTTMQVTHPRVVHSEFMTHCMFARNASSSRAIPFKKVVQRVIDDPFIPEHWGINKSGMQASEELTGGRRERAISKWLEARNAAVLIASEMASDKCLVCDGTGFDKTIRCGVEYTCPECEGDGLGLNVHKQIINRLIEPWSWITVCVTGDAGAWSNYFSLRCDKDAQPDIQKQAYMAQKAYFESTPEELQPGQWHTPYIKSEEYEQIYQYATDESTRPLIHETAGKLSPEAENHFANSVLIKISTGRCARTSYLTQEGIRDFAKDIELHDRLRYHVPLHASPFEHVCQAMGDGKRYAKYTGWKSYRHMLPREYIIDFKPNHPDLVGK